MLWALKFLHRGTDLPPQVLKKNSKPPGPNRVKQFKEVDLTVYQPPYYLYKVTYPSDILEEGVIFLQNDPYNIVQSVRGVVNMPPYPMLFIWNIVL